VFENRVLRKILGPKRDEVTEEWRRLHNEELHDLYSLPKIMGVIKSRIMQKRCIQGFGRETRWKETTWKT
jgi:hypothetical protein